MYQTRRMNDKNKVIVTAALTGAVTTKADNSNLPTQPKDIAASAIACYEAGASAVHIHVRDDETRSSSTSSGEVAVVNTFENSPA